MGIPTLSDKVLQRAVLMVLEPIYEAEFKESSYGFRPGRSCHQALEALRDGLMDKRCRVVLEVDIRDFFGSVDHKRLQEVVRKRIRDGVILRLIGKWLRAGVMESGVRTQPEKGTPQGGVISPLLANIYLHPVDVALTGAGFELIRYADDRAPRRRGREAEMAN